ncbi:MAG: hypothetical protein JWM99_98 [Verrucomicrobiales bacterium]|nr:hypothetical protein [Verrucomicrobiales bacterium]
MADEQWQVLTHSKLIGFAIGVTIFLFVLFKSEPGFVFLLDSANLLFHEAGHPFFGLISNRLAVYGGTLGQLTFPIALIISFWHKREPITFAASVIWFFENFLNIARYMADSRTLLLPLVGGGEHDWNEIFFRWTLLSNDTFIATLVKAIGWIGIGGTVGWLFWRGWQDRNRRSDPLPPTELEPRP